MQKHVNMCKNVKTDSNSTCFGHWSYAFDFFSPPPLQLSYSSTLAVHSHINSREDDKLSKSDGPVWPDQWSVIMGSVWQIVWPILHLRSTATMQKSQVWSMLSCFKKFGWNLTEFLSWYKPGYSWKSASKMSHLTLSSICTEPLSLLLPPNTAWLDGMRTKFRNSSPFTI